MISESAREKEEKATLGYWSECRKYYLVVGTLTAYERHRAWLKSQKQRVKAIINRRMAEGEEDIL
jgi:hypothetical protein